MKKWEPWRVLGVLVIWIAFSVLFGLLSGVCFITVTESMSVREQEVKAEQTESPVSVYPTPKEAITIEGTHVLVIGYPNVEQDRDV